VGFCLWYGGLGVPGGSGVTRGPDIPGQLISGRSRSFMPTWIRSTHMHKGKSGRRLTCFRLESAGSVSMTERALLEFDSPTLHP